MYKLFSAPYQPIVSVWHELFFEIIWHNSSNELFHYLISASFRICILTDITSLPYTLSWSFLQILWWWTSVSQPNGKISSVLDHHLLTNLTKPKIQLSQDYSSEDYQYLNQYLKNRGLAIYWELDCYRSCSHWSKPS